MNIVIPSFGLGATGGDRILTILANRLSERGHGITFVNLGRKTPHFLLSKKVKITFVPFKKRIPKNSQQKVSLILDGMAKLAAHLPQADIYLANWVFTVPPCIAHFQEGKTVFLAQANELFIAQKPAERILQGISSQSYLSSVFRVTPSAYLCDTFKERFGTESTIIPPGIDLLTFRPKKKKKGATKIFFSGDTKNKNKGFSLLVEALSLLKKRDTNLSFELIVASQREVLTDGLPFTCSFYRPKNDQELVKLYQSADISCFLSKEEGFGLSLLEAMACGATCLTTDSGGVREFAVQERNCLFVPREAKAIAHEIERVMQDASLRESLIKGGLETAQRYSEKRMVDTFEKYFISILHGT